MKRKIILITILIIALISLVLYRTLATDITMKETTGTADLTYNIDINDTDGRTITVEAGKTKVFDIFVTNKNGGSIKYGIAYKPTITTDIKVLKLNTSKDDVTGIINNDTTLQVTLVIDNKGTSNLTYNIIPITGYEKGGDLTVPSGYTMISETYKFPTTPSEKTLVKLGLTANEVIPNFANIATTDEGIYSAPDDYGISYYFRGASSKNYVKFVGYFWRIIRINGDGTIRMIYDGTTAHNNGEKSSDRQIGISQFNNTYGDNAYVGYMMGIDNECASTINCSGTTKTTTYDQATTNNYSSTIKIVVDNWYKINIKDAGFGEKVADVIYCNDRSIDTISGYGNGYGYGTNSTAYNARYRLNNNKIPKLACPQKNDAFTVEDKVKGNGALTYPVGLITADEVLMAGGVGYPNHPSNVSYYLYTGQDYWTMSPYSGGSEAYGNYVHFSGMWTRAEVTANDGIKPVISLKSDIQLTGLGTMQSPFEVK